MGQRALISHPKRIVFRQGLVSVSASFALPYPLHETIIRGWCMEGEFPEPFKNRGRPRALPQFAFSSQLPLRAPFSLRPNRQLLISALLAVASVLGAPNVKREDADPCKGLGTGAYSNLTNF